jgi:DNA invertase Pin-like site-specific DNA recombinase
MTKANRALIYVRKSMVRHRRDEISPERQLQNCLAAAEAHHWQVDETDVYQDAEGHRSGRSEDHRPAWQALKARVASDPTVAAVIVNSLDRGSRSPKDFFIFLDLLQKRGVEIVSVTEQFDTSTAIGRAFLAILMVVASLESDLASERTTSTIDYLKGQGVHWGYTPYGYTRDENAIPQPDDQAPAVVEALTYFAQGKRSYLDVARHMNAQGYRWRDRSGRPISFTRHAVRSLVSNVLVYAGWVPVGRGKDMTITDEAHTLRDLIQLTEAAPGQHAPLIDEELADQVLAARHGRLGLAVRRDERVYLLTPILYCANCGQQLRGKNGRKLTTPARYCHRQGAEACIASSGLEVDGSHDAARLEGHALEILDLHLPESALADLRDMIRERVRTRPENAQTIEHIKRLETQQARLRELYVLGDVSREEYLLARSGLLRQIEELEQQLGAKDYPLEAVLAQVDKVGAMLREGTRQQQKRAMALVFDRIEVSLEGKIERVAPKEWARPLFRDVAAMVGDHGCPQGNSNPCRRLERAVS